MFTPSASSTSAAPHLLEAARLPCLATGTPAAAITSDEVVEILNELAPSPPVPTISSTSISCSSRTAWARMPAAEAVISSMVSPFIASEVKYALIWISLACPLMISSITATAVS